MDAINRLASKTEIPEVPLFDGDDSTTQPTVT